MDKKHFISVYGSWAIIAGASEGIGEAFARSLAGIGFNLVLIARREALLKEEAQKLQDKYGICVRTINFDLSETEKLTEIDKMTADLDIGLLVYNAALSLVGPFMDNSPGDHLKEIDVNIKGPLVLTMLFGERFIKRGRGGIILMSSLTSSQGSPLVANYGATRAWNLILAEGLWYELKGLGVDVISMRRGRDRYAWLQAEPARSQFQGHGSRRRSKNSPGKSREKTRHDSRDLQQHQRLHTPPPDAEKNRCQHNGLGA